MPLQIVCAAAQALLLAVLFVLLGSLPSLAGRDLGPALGVGPVMFTIIVAFTLAAAGHTPKMAQRLTNYERVRNLCLVLLAWPVLAELAGGEIQRKRVILLAAAAAIATLAGAPLVRLAIGHFRAGDKRAWSTLAVVLVGALWAEYDPTPTRPEPTGVLRSNIVLISIDTMRWDALDFSPSGTSKTPFINQLANRGVIFDQAIAQAPHTPGSMAALLTSEYPIEHRAISWNPKLDATHETLATHLWHAGYATAGFLDNPWLRPEFGFTRGYEDFHAGPPLPAALDWIDAHQTERFFLHVHFLDPHGPYQARSPWIDVSSPDYEGPWEAVTAQFLESAEEPGVAQDAEVDMPRVRALYASEIAAADAEVGILLAHLHKLGLDQETLIVFVADHGEELLDHGALNHAHTLFDELVHVPLIMVGPDLPAGLRVTSQVELIDVLPTILAQVGVAPLEGARGRDLTPNLTAPPSAATAPPARIAVSQRYDLKQRHLLSARDGNWKLQICIAPTGPERFLDWDIAPHPAREFSRRNRYRLYNLKTDPYERLDVYDENPEVAQRLLSSLIDWRKANDPQMSISSRGSADTPDMSPQALQELRALGYLGDD